MAGLTKTEQKTLLGAVFLIPYQIIASSLVFMVSKLKNMAKLLNHI
jgi:hypothetical protein